MTTKTETRTKREHRTMLFPLTAEQLLPLDLAGVPEPIAKANEVAHEAVARAEEAKRQERESVDEANAAPRHDQLTAEAALAAGEDPPPPTVDAKRAAAAEAQRVADARERLAKGAVLRLYDAVEANLADYVEPRREAAERSTEPLRETIPTLLSRLGKFKTEYALYERARDFHNNPTSAAIGLGRSPATTLERRYERELERQRKRVRRNPRVENTLPALLAAITIAIEEEAAAGA